MTPGPADHLRHADAVLVQAAPAEVGRVRELVAALVADEDHQCVFSLAGVLQRRQHAAHSGIERLHHRRVVLAGTRLDPVALAVLSLERVAQRLVVRPLPGPVRRRVEQAQEERVGPGAPDELDGPVGIQVGDVLARAVHELVVLPHVGEAAGVHMAEVIHAAALVAEVLVEADLQRAVGGQVPAMPLAHQGGGVAARLEQRDDGRLVRGQPHLVPDDAGHRQRLANADGVAARVAARVQRVPRRRAHRRRGVGAPEEHALPGEVVEVRRLVIGIAVDAQVAPALVVGEDEEDVGLRALGV